MRRDIGHGSADCSDAAEGSRSRFLTGKAHLFLCPRALHRLEMASATECRICNQQISLEIQHSIQHQYVIRVEAGETPQKERRAASGRNRNDILLGNHWHLATSLLTTTTTMVSFPPELLGVIVAEVHSLPDLLRLRETNSTLNEFATPLAFRSLVLANRDKNIRNFTLLSKSKLAPFVREVVFQYMELDPSMFV